AGAGPCDDRLLHPLLLLRPAVRSARRVRAMQPRRRVRLTRAPRPHRAGLDRPPRGCGSLAECGPRPLWGRRALLPSPGIGRSGVSKRVMEQVMNADRKAPALGRAVGAALSLPQPALVAATLLWGGNFVAGKAL